MIRFIFALTFMMIAPAVAQASVEPAPTRLFKACEPLLDPPSARLWMVEKDNKRVVLMTARPAASVRHLPAWVKDVVTSARHFTGTTNALQHVGLDLSDQLAERMMRGEDFGVEAALGKEKTERLKKIMVDMGIPEDMFSLMPPLILNGMMIAKLVMASIERSEAQPDANWAKLLVARTLGFEPSEVELQRLVTEIDFNKSVLRLAQDSGAAVLDLVPPELMNSVLARFESVEFLSSLVNSVVASEGMDFKFDLFDGNSERLDAKIDTFMALAPAMADMADDSIRSYSGVVKRIMSDYPGTLLHTEVMTVMGSRGLLRRFKNEGYNVTPITSGEDWRELKSEFVDRTGAG